MPVFALVGTLAVTGFISLCGLFWVGVAYTSFRFAANIAGGKTIEEGIHVSRRCLPGYEPS
jgi:hypothetical protein